MYKILIVDDEELVRKAIISRLDWNAIGFNEVEEAEDGEQALEIALSFKPDVVLTDIRMPFMDGLELSENLLEALPGTKVVILSGHDEFEYAQEAIKLGILDYILKPIHSAKLTDILMKIRASLDMEKSEEEKLFKLKSQLHQSLPLLKERFFNSLISNSIRSDAIERNLDFLDINLSSGSFIVCASEIDNMNSIKELNDAEYAALMNFSILNISSELVADMGYVFNDTSGKQVMIISYDKFTGNAAESDMYKLLDNIRESIEKYLKVTITIGIGRKVSSPADIHLSYNDAVNALDYKIIMGKNRIYNIKDLDCKTQDLYFPLDKINILTSAVKLDNEHIVEEQVKGFFDDISRMKNISSDNVRILMIELVNSIQKIVIGISTETSLKACTDFKIYESIGKCETIEDYKNEISCFISNTCKSIHSSRNSRNHAIAEKVKQYINENYHMENITLNYIAAIVSVSPGYLSILFKKETGETFVEYIAKVRMEKAMELLKTTPMKAYEVAYKVGYSDPHYFSLCFKKHIGCTPSDYKNKGC